MARGSRYVATAVAVAVLVTASAVVATATSVTSNSASPGAYRADDYADAEDRLFLMDVLRHYGRGTLSEFLGPSCTFEQMDHDELLSAPYTEARARAQLEGLRRYGAIGVKARTMIESYVAGVNAYIAKATMDPSALPADYAAALMGPQPWKPTDVVYVAALIGGIFGKGGGGELHNAALVQYLDRFGPSQARDVFADIKQQ